jgi:pilus assembly protein CpaE
LAVNIGTQLAAGGKRAGLLDLRIPGGDAATLLDLQPANTIVDFCRHLNRMDESLFVRCLARHRQGLYLLAAPQGHSEGGQVTARGVRRAVNLARRVFDYILIDLDSGCRAHEAQGLLQTDLVLVVLRLDFTSIRRTQQVLKFLRESKIEDNRVRLIASRFRRPHELRVRDVEKVLGRRIAEFVPEDTKRVNAANNGGVPIILQFPRSPVSRSMRLIAASVNGHVPDPRVAATHKRQ